MNIKIAKKFAKIVSALTIGTFTGKFRFSEDWEIEFNEQECEYAYIRIKTKTFTFDAIEMANIAEALGRDPILAVEYLPANDGLEIMVTATLD